MSRTRNIVSFSAALLAVGGLLASVVYYQGKRAEIADAEAALSAASLDLYALDGRRAEVAKAQRKVFVVERQFDATADGRGIYEAVEVTNTGRRLDKCVLIGPGASVRPLGERKTLSVTDGGVIPVAAKNWNAAAAWDSTEYEQSWNVVSDEDRADIDARVDAATALVAAARQQLSAAEFFWERRNPEVPKAPAPTSTATGSVDVSLGFLAHADEQVRRQFLAQIALKLLHVCATDRAAQLAFGFEAGAADAAHDNARRARADELLANRRFCSTDVRADAAAPGGNVVTITVPSGFLYVIRARINEHGLGAGQMEASEGGGQDVAVYVENNKKAHLDLDMLLDEDGFPIGVPPQATVAPPTISAAHRVGETLRTVDGGDSMQPVRSDAWQRALTQADHDVETAFGKRMLTRNEAESLGEVRSLLKAWDAARLGGDVAALEQATRVLTAEVGRAPVGPRTVEAHLDRVAREVARLPKEKRAPFVGRIAELRIEAKQASNDDERNRVFAEVVALANRIVGRN